MPIRLVVLDLDGTLLTDEMTISPATERTVRAVRRQGVAVVIATGRPFPSARPYARELRVDLLIPHNGAQIRGVVEGEVIHDSTLDPVTAADLMEMVRAEGLTLRVYAGDTLLVPRVTEEVRLLSEMFGVPVRAVGDLAGLMAAGEERANMLTVRADRERLDRLEADLTHSYARRATCHRPNPYALDIVAAGAGKEHALRVVAERLGVTPEDVLAVGNGENDAGMLRWARTGVAVANAPASLRALADWVAPDNNNDGVAAALYQYVLRGE